MESIALGRLLPGGACLLELGAGGGRNTLRYVDFKQIVLLDYSVSQLEHAQKRLGKKTCYRFVAADIYRLPFMPGSFDCATMIRTLAGFRLEKTRTVSHFRTGFLKKHLPLKTLVWMDSILQPTGNLIQLSPSVFTRSKALNSAAELASGSIFKCPNCDFGPLEDTPPAA